MHELLTPQLVKSPLYPREGEWGMTLISIIDAMEDLKYPNRTITWKYFIQWL